MTAALPVSVVQGTDGTLSYATPSRVVKRAELDAAEQAALAHIREVLALGGQVTFANSLGREDMAILDLVRRHQLPVEVFTLDTGRLPDETLELLARAEERYRLRIKVYYPDSEGVAQWVAQNGINGFRDSVSQRKGCCGVRKIEPLKRALAGKAAWLVGLRRAHGELRADAPAVQQDEAFGLVKCAPIVDWDDALLDAYLAAHDVPVSTLHAKGYPSVGCAPCTRPVEPGESPRAGRWWWEQGAARECGLHWMDKK